MTFLSKLLLLTVAALTQVTAAHADGTEPDRFLGPIVRGHEMNQIQAIDHCSTRGGLPTIRQLAEALNPRGVSTTNQYGYTRITPLGQPAFYYTQTTYSRPADDEDTNQSWFWSASIDEWRNTNAFIFDSRGGFIRTGSIRGDTGTVRCMDGE